MSFLSAIVKVPKAIFDWLASPKGVAVVTTAGAILTAVDPALGGIVLLAESWIKKVVTTEQLASAAGAQTGTGTQKAAAVIDAMQSEVGKYFPAATADQIQKANAAIVAFLNAFDTPNV